MDKEAAISETGSILASAEISISLFIAVLLYRIATRHKTPPFIAV
jgi:hypothetical protein